MLWCLQEVAIPRSMSLRYSPSSPCCQAHPMAYWHHGTLYTSSHYCSWPGVVCSRRQPERVVSLLVGSFNLSGHISPSLGNLSFVKKLDLHGNQFVGQIPPELGQLRRLQMLNLSTNTLHGRIPAAMDGCTNLTTVDLSNNLLQGEIPNEVGTLKNLVDLRLHKNDLSGKIPLSLTDSLRPLSNGARASTRITR